MTSGGLTCGVNRGRFKFAHSAEENKERERRRAKVGGSCERADGTGRGWICGVWEVNKRDYARSVKGHSHGRGG